MTLFGTWLNVLVNLLMGCQIICQIRPKLGQIYTRFRLGDILAHLGLNLISLFYLISYKTLYLIVNCRSHSYLSELNLLMSLYQSPRNKNSFRYHLSSFLYFFRFLSKFEEQLRKKGDRNLSLFAHKLTGQRNNSKKKLVDRKCPDFFVCLFFFQMVSPVKYR